MVDATLGVLLQDLAGDLALPCTSQTEMKIVLDRVGVFGLSVSNEVVHRPGRTPIDLYNKVSDVNLNSAEQCITVVRDILKRTFVSW